MSEELKPCRFEIDQTGWKGCIVHNKSTVSDICDLGLAALCHQLEEAQAEIKRLQYYVPEGE